jgi:hypothetical protein
VKTDAPGTETPYRKPFLPIKHIATVNLSGIDSSPYIDKPAHHHDAYR